MNISINKKGLDPNASYKLSKDFKYNNKWYKDIAKEYDEICSIEIYTKRQSHQKKRKIKRVYLHFVERIRLFIVQWANVIQASFPTSKMNPSLFSPTVIFSS